MTDGYYHLGANDPTPDGRRGHKHSPGTARSHSGYLLSVSLSAAQRRRRRRRRRRRKVY